MRILSRVLLLCCCLLIGLIGDLAAAEYTVRPGDTLSAIAAAELGDAERWREIAVLNNIAQPQDLKVGQVLRLPDRRSGRAGGDRPDATSPEAQPPPAWPFDELIGTPPAPASEESAQPGWLDRVADLDIVSFLLGIAATVAIGWLVLSLALKISCWLLFIESPWGTCLYVSFLLALLAVGFLLILYALLRFSSHIGGATAPIALTLLVAWLLSNLFAIRRVYNCPWRTAVVIVILWNVCFDLLLMLTYFLVVVVIIGLFVAVLG